MEVVARATVVFWMVFLLTRSLQRRALGDMAPFEMVLLVVLGDINQQGVMQQDYSVTGAMLSLAAFGFWLTVMTFITHATRRVLEAGRHKASTTSRRSASPSSKSVAASPSSRRIRGDLPRRQRILGRVDRVIHPLVRSATEAAGSPRSCTPATKPRPTTIDCPAPRTTDMAYVCREFGRPATDLWSVLVDPTTYPSWLIGAAEIRDVDERWPAIGSAFHHRVGVGPLSIPDESHVLAITPGSMLRLRVRARPLIAAVVTFHIVGDHRRCVVTVEEEPARRIIGNAVRPVLDPIIHVRNHRSLRRLDEHLAVGGPTQPGN